MRPVLAVSKHHRFVVVDKAQAEAYEVIGENLVLQPCGNRETEVHLLEILFGDTERFAFGQGVFPKIVVEGVDGVLEIFSLWKVQKRDGGLDKD